MKFLLILPMFIALSLEGHANNQKTKILKYATEHIGDTKEATSMGIPASICIAQGILESGYGYSPVALDTKNHFGVTHGSRKKTKGKYRRYETVADSFRDYAHNLATYPAYAALFLIPATDYRAWAKGLQAAGYSESSNYASALIQIIEKGGISELDKPKSDRWADHVWPLGKRFGT